VVRDYCAAVRGILDDDPGGPLDPPGLRMALALIEVQESLDRNLGAKKGDSRRSNSAGARDAFWICFALVDAKEWSSRPSCRTRRSSRYPAPEQLANDSSLRGCIVD